MNNRSEKQPKMDKIADISVGDISKVGFAQIASSPKFFNIFQHFLALARAFAGIWPPKM